MIDLTLANLREGALEEMFQGELEKIIKDIQNPNTDPMDKRSISIKVSFAPFKNNREMCGIVVSCNSKLGKAVNIEGFVSMAMDPISGEVAAGEYKPKQQDMFPPAPEVSGEGSNVRTFTRKQAQ